MHLDACALFNEEGGWFSSQLDFMLKNILRDAGSSSTISMAKTKLLSTTTSRTSYRYLNFRL
jgi:hypothetical protein